MIRITDPGPKLTQSQLDAVEKILGVVFPPQYRTFMLETNGGFPEPNSFDLKDGGDGSCLSYFYSIGLAGEQREQLTSRQEFRAGRLPTKFIAIGPDPGCNEICLNCSIGADYGKIYFWDHDFECDAVSYPDMTPETAGNYHLVANSFTEFLGCLNEDETFEDTRTAVKNTTPEAKARFEAVMKRMGPPKND